MQNIDAATSARLDLLLRRARAAQHVAEGYDQARVDELVAAAGWAILEPERNRALAERAVADTGFGDVADKQHKNHHKTLGLLRDLQGARSVGVIAEDPARGIVEIARAVGVVCAVTPSTNPAATPVNKIINALKGRNAVIVAPSPKGWGTAELLIGYIHAQFDRIGAPRNLVQVVPAPVTRAASVALMRGCDLVLASGSQTNVRAAHSSGRPAFGVGVGNAAVIVDETADVDAAADRVMRSKTFDHATSCSSENSLIVVQGVREKMLTALHARGAVLLDTAQRATLQRLMWPDGRLSHAVIGQSVTVIAQLAGWPVIAASSASVLLVDEGEGEDVGPGQPFSQEKLCPVLTLYTVPDFEAAARLVERLYARHGAGHSVGLHSADAGRALQLGQRLPVARVIVNQAHCLATGGSFDNGLPFSLSMGCGTWGGNHFSDNLGYRHCLNITRISRPIAERVPSEQDLLGDFFAKYGRT